LSGHSADARAAFFEKYLILKTIKQPRWPWITMA